MIKQESLPSSAGIKNCLKVINYSDTFSLTNHKDQLSDITQKVFATAPGWVVALMKFRNNIVKVFGLKTDIPNEASQRFVVGGRVAFFKIYQILDNEVILGEDDSHLNFRVSVLDSKSPENNIKITTLVEYNNWFGRLYFMIVKPFHKVIVKIMMKNALP